MQLHLNFTDNQAAELLEAASEAKYVSWETYEKVHSAIKNAVTEAQFKEIEKYQREAK